MTTEKVYTTGEVAKFCNVNFRTVIRWIQKGYLSAYQLPGRGDNRISQSSLMTFMQANNLPIPSEFDQEQRILIVDDEKEMASAIQRVLKRKGFTTEIAENGFVAGHLMSSFKPQLMTLDLRMPGLSGHDVLHFIKQNEAHKHIKVLVISAQPEADLNRALAEGADAILAKPFQNGQLISSIEQLLA